MYSARTKVAARACANPRIANFAGPKEIDRGPAFTPAVAPVKSITPWPRACHRGRDLLGAKKSPKALTRHAVSYCSAVTSTIVPQVPLPAL